MSLLHGKVAYEAKFPGHAEGSWWKVMFGHLCQQESCSYDDCPALEVGVAAPGRGYSTVIYMTKPKPEVVLALSKALADAVPSINGAGGSKQ